VYRVFEYIAGSALAGIERPEQAYEAARVLGEFAQLMADLPAPSLHVTLPDFHATDRRLQQLTAALVADTAGRAGAVQREWREISARRALADESALLAKSRGLPLRVTHNDTKLNNVLFDTVSGRALCLIDLDTVMPGYVAYDFGDLVRSCVVSEAEDSRELGRSGVRMDVFEAIAQGYLSELGASLSAVERLSLARGALWIVLELAMRFLTDYLQGDWYFKIARPEHNLERAQAQLQLLAALEAHADEFTRALGAAG
jgi:Ser/Thr protein kinase RdoA (MazF antagonist)